MGVSPVTRPGNQAGQGRPGPDIHGGDVGRPAPYPSPFYQSLSNPNKPRILPTSPMCLSAPCLSSKPLIGLPIPTQSSFHSSLPAVFHDFMIFMISELPYPTCLSTKRQCEIKFEENPVPQRNEHLRLEKRKSPK